ncbi:hypothetical protein [Rhodohalobacter sp. 614A]|uniref:hypothetical protein n=1 Tax=Rhodohalobacter sp. 614A TaxID=2908649 RepID=UPI001F39AC37|nr:hypothetical protein [Rhodohalobacter sp. 614A]
MALLFITSSALLFYSTSKYFPLSLQEKISVNKNIGRLAGLGLWVIGVAFLVQDMKLATAITVSLVSWMTILPLLIFSLTLYPKSWIVWVILLTATAVLDLVVYAG